MSTAAISLKGARKRFPGTWRGAPITALDGVDLEVKRGELFGLLGPNGAGKTTTVKVLLGLTRADSGEASLLGMPVGDPESRRRVGYLPEGHRFPGYLTARQTLHLFGRMSGMEDGVLKRRTPELLERVGIGKWADQKVRKFSKGMTQRLGLASAMIHDPELLLLDEPTDGVDPVGRREIRDLLKALAADGRTVFINSHLLGEIELTCDRVAIMNKGKVVRAGSVNELTARGMEYLLVADAMDEPVQARLRAAGAELARVNGHLRLTARDTAHLNELIDSLRASQVRITELTPLRDSLEDLFVGLVRPADGAEKSS